MRDTRAGHLPQNTQANQMKMKDQSCSASLISALSHSMLLLLDAQKSSKVFSDSAFLILTFSFLKSFVPSKLSSLMTHPCHMHGSVFVDVSSLNGMLAPLCQPQCTAVFASILVPLLSSIDSPIPQNSDCNSHPLTLATPVC